MVFNEKKFVENVISGTQKIDIFKFSRKNMIILMCKYYNLYSDTMTSEEIVSLIEKNMEQIYSCYFIPEMWHYYISKTYNSCYKYKIFPIERDKICIYQSEIEEIQSLNDENKEKVLFTCLVLSKYYQSNYYIMTKNKKKFIEMFKLSNFRGNNDQKVQIIKELNDLGYLKMTESVDNLNQQIIMDVKPDKVAIEITSMDNLGNQYLNKYKKGYKMCALCGKMFKIYGKNSKYCKSCRKKQDLQRYKKYNSTR